MDSIQLNYSETQEQYWGQKLKNPRSFTLFFCLLNFYFASMAFANPNSPEELRWNIAFFILTFIILALVLPSLFSSKYNWAVRYGFMIQCVRMQIYSFDFYNVKHLMKTDEWLVYCQFSVWASAYMLHYHFLCFNPQEAGFFAFGVFYSNIIFTGIYVSAMDIGDLFEANEFKRFLPLSLIAQFLIFFLIRNETQHGEAIARLFTRIQNHQFLRLVLDTSTDSLLILDSQQNFTYANPRFQAAFKQEIESAVGQSSYQSSRGLPSSSNIIKSMLQKWKCFRGCFQKKRESGRLNDIITQIEDKDFLNQLQPVLDQPLFKLKAVNQEAEQPGPALSMRSIFENGDLSRIYVASRPREGEQEGILDDQNGAREPAQELAYYKFGISSLEVNGRKRTLVTITDVSRSVLYDESKEKNELLALINATVSHELRNPLNSIIAQNTAKEAYIKKISQTIGQVKDPNLVAEVQEYINKMQESLAIQNASTDLMSFLVQDFLDYAQIKSGNFRTNIRPFNIREAVENVISIQKEKATEAGIALEAIYENIGEDDQAPESLFSPIIFSDQKRIMQVLLNLQSNALKFTKEGAVKIKVSIVEVDATLFLQVAVQDTGIGIPYSDQDKLFKLFGFIQSTEHCNVNGIGLGLVISERIVHQFGGTIEFQSVPCPDPQHGTTFTFKFKLGSKEEYLKKRRLSCHGQLRSLNQECLIYDWSPVLPHGSHQQTEEENLSMLDCSSPKKVPRDTKIKFRGLEDSSTRPFSESLQNSMAEPPVPTILIVDDQVFNIQALKVILQFKFGIDPELCDCAFNGQEALDLVKARLEQKEPLYSLILMDCNMPFMDGFESTRRIRQLIFDEKHLGIRQQPIISAVTGHAEPSHITKCFNFGMNQVLSKPLEHSALKYALLQSGIVSKESLASLGKKDS